MICGSAIAASKSCFGSVDFANGCDAGDVFFCETAQHAMFAQQPLLHASLLGALERMHDAAGRRTGATATAAVTTTIAINCFNITYSVAQIEPRVE